MTAAGIFQTTAGSNLILSAPGSNKLKGRQFYVQASGFVSCASGTYTATLQPVLYGDASLATVTTKPLFSATAGTMAFTGTVAAAIPWALWSEFEGDSLSGTFWGVAQSTVGATLKAQTITVLPVSAINFATDTLGASPKFIITEFNIIQE
jgi:hypothetical protein